MTRRHERKLCGDKRRILDHPPFTGGERTYRGPQIHPVQGTEMPASSKVNLYQYLKSIGNDTPAPDGPTSNRPSRTAPGASGTAPLDAPSRLRRLAAVQPVEEVIDDPVFNTEDA